MTGRYTYVDYIPWEKLKDYAPSVAVDISGMSIRSQLLRGCSLVAASRCAPERVAPGFDLQHRNTSDR